MQKYSKYMQDNRMKMIEYKNEEATEWDRMIQYNDSIFIRPRLFLNEYLKWCCV